MDALIKNTAAYSSEDILKIYEKIEEEILLMLGLHAPYQEKKQEQAPLNQTPY